MDNQLTLANIRNVLTRLEETIIFGLIERAQFCNNPIIYQAGGLGNELDGESLVDFLLHECERSHAKVRRYTSPDEQPFFDDLPEPVLPSMAIDSPLHPNDININSQIRTVYEKDIVPFICRPGDDSQYGSSAVNDVGVLQAISKRIHYGKFVAESKYQQDIAGFDELIRAQDENGLMKAITNQAVQDKVLDRVSRKTATYGSEIEESSSQYRVAPNTVRETYARWIIPMNKQVQVTYLLERLR